MTMKTPVIALLITSLVAIALSRPLNNNANELLDFNAMMNGVEAQAEPAKEPSELQ